MTHQARRRFATSHQTKITKLEIVLNHGVTLDVSMTVPNDSGPVAPPGREPQFWAPHELSPRRR
jgi:hypothetical protein